jgi:pimeloyl-ACP methyl ester carboxylesterase
MALLGGQIMKSLLLVLIVFFSLSVCTQAAGKKRIPNQPRAVANTVIDGRLGPGALYRLVKPDNWNGRLLLYAHGYTYRSVPVALPAEAETIAAIATSQGFAMAFSSFSENGWAVKEGAQRTHQLLGIFKSKFGQPAKVYLAGASMGGLIAIKLAEEFPNQFAGVLPACAVAGGTRLHFDYYSNVRALFDVFYPNTLPGNAGDVPQGIDTITQIVGPATAAMLSDGGAGAGAIASFDQAPVPFASGPELFESILSALVGHADAYSDLVPFELNGKAFFENRNTQYTSSLLSPVTVAFADTGVGRFAASPSALNYMKKYYQPTGNLKMPMVMLATSRDPVVPGFHQTSYAGLVAASGNSNLVFQRTVDRYGHCNFTPEEMGAAFGELVAWVEFGVPPPATP